MTSRSASNIFDSNTGFLAVVREFLTSVELLNHTVLFPVKLQDIDQSGLSPDVQLLQLIKQTTDDENEAMDLFAVYMLLLNTRSELLTGNDISGEPSGGDSVLGQQLKALTSMLKSLSKLAHTIRGEYETCLSAQQ